jgi:hypothetical protein
MSDLRVSHTDDPELLGDSRFADVPAAEDDAELDPHWVDLRGSSPLPTGYMPPSMAGPRRPWQQLVAVGLTAMFLGATAAGVCLTYGPPLP